MYFADKVVSVYSVIMVGIGMEWDKTELIEIENVLLKLSTIIYVHTHYLHTSPSASSL